MKAKTTAERIFNVLLWFSFARVERNMKRGNGSIEISRSSR